MSAGDGVWGRAPTGGVQGGGHPPAINVSAPAASARVRIEYLPARAAGGDDQTAARAGRAHRPSGR